MKKVFITLGILISAIIVLQSCKKEELENYTTKKNPLEYVGIEHNKFMRQFTIELKKSEKKWKKIDFLSDEYETFFSSIMNDAYHNCYDSSTSTIEFNKGVYKQLNLKEWFDGDSINSLDLAKAVMNEGSLITTSKSNLKEKATIKDEKFTMALLQDIFEVSSKKYNSKQESFNALEKIIKKHENLILSQDWKKEETYALGALAIAKYSTQFWKNYDFSLSKNSIFPNYYKNKEMAPSSSIIVGADVAGYVIGGVIGGVSGSAVGPAGTIGGVLGGKAIGAWTGSAAAATALAIYDAWSDFFN